MPHRITILFPLFASMLFSQNANTVVGVWEGRSEWTDGREDHVSRFRMTFRKSGRIAGWYSEPEGKVAERITILKISSDTSSYRMNVGDACWNVTVAADRFTGMMNYGKCSVAGVGSAARLIDVEAKPVR